VVLAPPLYCGWEVYAEVVVVCWFAITNGATCAMYAVKCCFNLLFLYAHAWRIAHSGYLIQSRELVRRNTCEQYKNPFLSLQSPQGRIDRDSTTRMHNGSSKLHDNTNRVPTLTEIEGVYTTHYGGLNHFDEVVGVLSASILLRKQGWTHPVGAYSPRRGVVNLSWQF